jgi:hypothetical protein
VKEKATDTMVVRSVLSHRHEQILCNESVWFWIPDSIEVPYASTCKSNVAASLPQNQISCYKILLQFRGRLTAKSFVLSQSFAKNFLRTLKRINLHLKKALRFLGIVEFAFLERRRFILTTYLITISQISFLSFIHSQTQLFVSIASPPWQTDLLLTRYRTCLCKIAFFWWLTPFDILVLGQTYSKHIWEGCSEGWPGIWSNST